MTIHDFNVVTCSLDASAFIETTERQLSPAQRRKFLAYVNSARYQKILARTFPHFTTLCREQIRAATAMILEKQLGYAPRSIPRAFDELITDEDHLRAHGMGIRLD
jgi:hypothetical protein